MGSYTLFTLAAKLRSLVRGFHEALPKEKGDCWVCAFCKGFPTGAGHSLAVSDAPIPLGVCGAGEPLPMDDPEYAHPLPARTTATQPEHAAVSGASRPSRCCCYLCLLRRRLLFRTLVITVPCGTKEVSKGAALAPAASSRSPRVARRLQVPVPWVLFWAPNRGVWVQPFLAWLWEAGTSPWPSCGSPQGPAGGDIEDVGTRRVQCSRAETCEGL